MQLLFVVLAAFAYRGLLTFDTQADLSREIEEWFFIPTETSPLVIVLLAGWLVYRRRERLAALLGTPPAWGLAVPALLASLGVFVWSSLAQAPGLLAISLLFQMLGIAALLFGAQGVRIVSWPALLLVFAVPVPPPLLAEVVYTAQLWTAEYAGWLLFLIGESAYVSGDQILLAENHFAVIEGCSGLRSVQTLMMVAVLLVDLFGRRGWQAVLIIGLAPPVAFALNGLRVLALILNPHSEVVAIHNLQGVVILLAGLAILYAVDGLLERYATDRDGEGGGSPEALPADEPAGSGPRRVAVGGATGSLALLAVLSLVIAPWPGPAEPEEITVRDLPLEIDGWRGEEEAAYEASFLGAIGYRSRLRRTYHAPTDEAPVELLLLVGDLDQRYRSPISPKTVPPGSGWIVEQAEREGDRGRYVMRSGTRRVVVEHWYEGRSGLAAESVRFLLSLDHTPWHRPEDVMVVRLSTEVDGATRGAVERARDRLSRFATELEPELARLRQMLSRKRVS